ncbi:serine hydrolase domain-containing protein [Pseudonocardia sp. TRM90224]|uniref:serine hydrolase domain-containing protein n=1 Tax=Pseudonocardia sp. TRM90224 TaxID=2812678 RepID=UPI001E42A828|nr:serine hydrolase domain-containing protein [Pseudonocardia sp. TRM90224]
MHEITETVESLLAEHGCPGCAVGIAHRDETVLAAYGQARTDPAAPFRVDTRVPVASMSKPFTATAVLALVEAGKVELDAPVRTYLPDFRVADEAASKAVTVRHLLRHAVGWIGDIPGEGDRGDGALAAHVVAMKDAPQVLPPGTTFSYANSGFVVAGRIVEVVTGEVYEEHVRRTILEPLGMTSSTFFAEQSISAPAMSGLVPRCANPAGGLISTAADQLAWLRWWMSDDERGPITVATRRRMFTELVPVGAGPASAGLSWHIVHHPGADLVYHEGRLSGSASVGLFVPQARFAAVVLTNADAGEPLHRALTEKLLAEYAGIQFHDPQLQPDVDAATVAALVGSYVVPHIGGPDERISVRSQDSGLVIRLESEHDPDVHPDGLQLGREQGDLFRVRNGVWRGFPAEFLRTDDGALLGLRIGGRVFRRTHSDG